MGEIVCYKMVFGAMLRYVIFIGTCGSLDFVALVFLTNKNTKNEYMRQVRVYKYMSVYM